jgi:hypothetical protein
LDAKPVTRRSGRRRLPRRALDVNPIAALRVE